MNKYEFNFNGKNIKYYLRDDVDFSVFNEVFKIREYKSADEYLKNAKYPIIDIGAHVGFFSMYVACFSNVNIYSIEPEKNNFELLQKHKNENNLKNIKTYKCGIGGKSGRGELLIKEDSINHRILRNGEHVDKDVIQETNIFSFNDFLTKNNIDKVSLVKMDIEGGEYDILKSLKVEDFLKIGAIVMEYHILNKEENNIFIENMLRENGFSVQVFPSHYEKDLGFIFATNKRFDKK